MSSLFSGPGKLSGEDPIPESFVPFSSSFPLRVMGQEFLLFTNLCISAIFSSKEGEPHPDLEIIMIIIILLITNKQNNNNNNNNNKNNNENN